MFGNSITKFLKLDNLISNITGYFETKVELLKVEVKEELAQNLGKVIHYLLVAFVFGLVILFISLGVAIVLAQKIGDFWGFAVVALFYLLVGIILLLNGKSLMQKFSTLLSETFKKKK